jgi:hypothetical protein
METAFKIPRLPAFDAYMTILALGATLGDSSSAVSVRILIVPLSIF